MPDLSRKRERDRLPVRREPHWHRLLKGGYLGFRRGPETWIAKYRDRLGERHYKAVDDAGPNDYDGAKKVAEEWFASLGAPTVRAPKRATVRAGLEAYVEDLRRHGRPEAATDAQRRFRLNVYDDKIAEFDLAQVTREDFEAWRGRHRAGRKPRSINRHVRSIAAGLDRAVGLGYVGNPAAWRLKPLRDDVEDEGETAVFLTAEHRTALIAAASPQAALFLRGLELTGARPGELSRTIVKDFDGETLRLAHRKGKPPRLQVRHTALGSDGLRFFAEQASDKLPAVPLFTEDGETPWRPHMWARQIRLAIAKHNQEARGNLRIPLSASAYSFRHARISELLQVYGIDPLTVAQQTGTSLVMIEKSYRRFFHASMREKLDGIRVNQP
jgi:integrase